MDKYDVVIIGGSYAGMSAAMALGRARRNTLVIDAGDPCNKSTPYAHNFLTHDGSTPLEISTIAKNQVLNYPSIHWHHANVYDVIGEKGSFEVAIDGGKTVLAKRVVLAGGIKDELPGIPGFGECWGKTIIHCPYCHGYEFSDQMTGILVQAGQALEMVNMIGNWTKYIKLFLVGGDQLDGKELDFILDKNVQIINKPIIEVVHTDGIINHVTMSDHTHEPLKALYARLPFKQKIPFVELIGCAIADTGHIEVDMFGKTSVDGVYAVGDCAHLMRAISTAVNTGNIAGAMVNKDLIEEGC